MKKKQFMSKLAALTMAAAMGLSAAPATAVFAATTSDYSEDNVEDTTNGVMIKADVDAALTDVGTRGNANVASVDDSASALANKIQNALNAFEDKNYAEANYVAAISGSVTDGDFDSTNLVLPKKFKLEVSATAGGKTTIQKYDVSLDVPVVVANLTNAQKANIVGAAVKKQLEDASLTMFGATGEPTNTTVKAKIEQAISDLERVHDGITKNGAYTPAEATYTYTVNSIADGSTESTNTTQGKVTGSVTITIPETKEDATNHVKADPAGTVTINFETARPFADGTLSAAKMTAIKAYATAAGKYADDVTSDDVAKDINKHIQDLIDGGDTSWNGITASVGQITKNVIHKHGTAAAAGNGSFTATVTLTSGTNQLAEEMTFDQTKHADGTKLSELDAALTKAGTDFRIKTLQAANATTPAKTSAVLSAIESILKTAVDSKVNSVALNAGTNGDGWKTTYTYTPTDTSAATSETIDYKSGTTGKAVTISEAPSSDYSYDVNEGYKFKDDTKTYVGPNQVIASYVYKPATASEDGSLAINYTYAVADDNGGTVDAKPTADGANATVITGATKTVSSSTTVTLTIPKLKAKADTYLRFKDTSKTWKYDSTKSQSVAAESGETENTDADNTYQFDVTTDLLRDGNDDLTWTSSNPSAVLVDQTGKVTLKGVGTATITVTSKTNPSLTASIAVNADEKYKFTDVQDSSTYYFNPVYWGARNSVVAGESATAFGVGHQVTRAQFVTYLWRANGKQTVASSNNFTDVDAKAYYKDAVDWAVSKGIVFGKGNNTFDPNGVLDRAQAVAMMYRTYGGGQKYNGSNTREFSDVSENAYYYDAVLWAVRYGITAGKSNTKFAPNDECTREQGVTFLYNYYGGKDVNV